MYIKTTEHMNVSIVFTDCQIIYEVSSFEYINRQDNDDKTLWVFKGFN